MTSDRLWVAVDGMGGDDAPGEILEGCLQAHRAASFADSLCGRDQPDRVRARLQTLDSQNQLDNALNARALGADAQRHLQSAWMHEEATAVRRKRDASVNVAMDLVKTVVRRLSDLLRGKFWCCDGFGHLPPRSPSRDRSTRHWSPVPHQGPRPASTGAGCGSKYGLQACLHASIRFARQHLLPRRPSSRSPSRWLLNIGEEECKGNELALRTHELLREETRLHFAGNCEGRDVLSGEFDVVVCDGFTGNVLLKFLESVGSVLLGVLQG